MGKAYEDSIFLRLNFTLGIDSGADNFVFETCMINIEVVEAYVFRSLQRQIVDVPEGLTIINHLLTRPDTIFKGSSVSILGSGGLVDSFHHPREGVAFLITASLLCVVEIQAVIEPVGDDNVAIGTKRLSFLD